MISNIQSKYYNLQPMKSILNWGLVIQGPLIGFGSGPNNSKLGFNAEETIRENIKIFTPYVSKIVLSTWVGSGFYLTEDELKSGVIMLESQIPNEIRPDNRLKQFTSTLAGINYLRENSPATHFLKIRTDQLVDPKLINWLDNFFVKHPNEFIDKETTQKNYLIFSEYRKDSPFYLGDFIIAGIGEDIVNFCEANLVFKSRNMHPSAGTDYVLKYLIATDKKFYSYFYKFYPLLLQVANLENNPVQTYWNTILYKRVSTIPKNFYITLKWRNRYMTDILSPKVVSDFSFNEEWSREKDLIDNLRIERSVRYLIPSLVAIKVAKYEYLRYYRSLTKYFLIKLGFDL